MNNHFFSITTQTEKQESGKLFPVDLDARFRGHDEKMTPNAQISNKSEKMQ